jgi:hypothetical protein
MVATLDTREQTADRLLTASARHSYDPLTDIDWSAPLLDGVFFLPQHRVSLYGTDLWAGLDHHRRVELSRHEAASMASVGIWFEVILLQLLARYIYDRDPTTRHVQYALTEIADECRHSVMFGRMISKFGVPAYGPGRRAHELARVLKTTSNRAEMFAAILVAEEILDRLQREAKDDESVQPLVRRVSHIHVVEEARHVRYAREELERQWPRLSAAQRALSRLIIADSARIIAARLVHEDAYAAVGLDPREARAVARANPYRQETLRWAAERITAFFEDLGILSGPARLIWQRAGLA